MALAWYSFWLGAIGGIWIFALLNPILAIFGLIPCLFLVGERISFFMGLVIGFAFALISFHLLLIPNDQKVWPRWKSEVLRSEFTGRSSSSKDSTLNISASLIREGEPLGSCLRQTILIGSGECLSRQSWKTFNFLGISHLLVLSGSHLSIIALILLFVLRRPAYWLFGLSAHRFLGAMVFVALMLFMTVADRGASLWRAFVGCALIMLVSRILPLIYRYSTLDRLGLCGLLILVCDVRLAFDLSYLLSFGATTAVVMALKEPRSSLLLNAVWVPAAILCPLLSCFQLKTHYLSPLINLAFIPVFSFVILPTTIAPLFVSSLGPMAERLLSSIFEGCMTLSFNLRHLLPLSLPSTLVSAFFLIMGLTLGPRLSGLSRSIWMSTLTISHIGIQLLKVYFDI